MHDHHTSTVSAAEAFERHRAGAYAEPVDRTLGVEDRILMARDRQDEHARRVRDDEKRARGEYVPTPAMSLAAGCCSLALAQRGVFGVEVEPILHKGAEGVVVIKPEDISRPRTTLAEVVEAMAFCYPESQPTPYDNGVWARIAPFGEEVA